MKIQPRGDRALSRRGDFAAGISFPLALVAGGAVIHGLAAWFPLLIAALALAGVTFAVLDWFGIIGGG